MNTWRRAFVYFLHVWQLSLQLQPCRLATHADCAMLRCHKCCAVQDKYCARACPAQRHFDTHLHHVESEERQVEQEGGVVQDMLINQERPHVLRVKAAPLLAGSTAEVGPALLGAQWLACSTSRKCATPPQPQSASVVVETTTSRVLCGQVRAFCRHAHPVCLTA